MKRSLGFIAGLVLGQVGCVPPTHVSDQIASIEIFGNSTVAVGASVILHTILKNSSGSTIDPGSRNITLTWVSSDPSIASVNSQGVVTGHVAGLSTVITAKSGDVSDGFFMTVTGPPAVPVATVTVTGTTPLYLSSGGDAQFQAVTRDASGNQLFNRTVVWSSDHVDVATVNVTSGLVSPVGQGSVIITATSEGKSGSFSTRVTLHVFRIALSGPTSVRIGETIQLSAEARHTSETVILNPTLTWQSDNLNVATVSSNGLVTGVGTGTATISASSEGKSGFLEITVSSATVASVLQGRVIDFVTQNGISGATVRFFVNGNQVGVNTTNASGDFTSDPITIPVGGVVMEASATTYVTGRVLVDRGQNSTTVYTESIPLVHDAALGFIAGTVKNARNGVAVAGAHVRVFDNISPNYLRLAVSGNDGTFTTEGVPAGTYRLEASATGYQTTQRVGVAVGNGATTSGQDLALSPTGTNDIRIVLTWGEEPQDLDSHLTGPNTDVSRFHVFFGALGNLTGPPFARLDLDDVFSFGPETITITQMNSGNYRYSVHDFDNQHSATSTALGSSGAKVQVYTSTALIQTFFVPHAAGTLWTVFEMSGTLANPAITPRNEMSFASNSGTITTPPSLVAPRSSDADLIARVVRRGVKVRF
jgi:uncharacterized protein YjdB